MRNEFTDKLGDQITTEFEESDLSISKFIDSKVASGAFDVTETTFHIIECNNIISVYYHTYTNRWYAKL